MKRYEIDHTQKKETLKHLNILLKCYNESLDKVNLIQKTAIKSELKKLKKIIEFYEYL